jgi:outer membrane protein OmpA-like peptidoglycan-associated protein
MRISTTRLAAMGASIAVLLTASAAMAQDAAQAGPPGAAAPAAAPVEGKLKGMINARRGSQLSVATAPGQATTVMLTPATKISAISGALGLQSDTRADSDLVIGLPVEVDTVADGTGLTAAKITFKSKDQKTAYQVQAGTATQRARLTEAEAQNAELRRRMSQATEYVEKDRATVYFAVGKSTLSSEGKAELTRIASKAHAIKGYFIGVVGYADPTGDAEANQRLSERRASSVVEYLQKHGDVQSSRVLAPDAMGEDKATGDVSSSQGLAANRRVVVKVLTNKGLEGLEAPPGG